MPLTYLDNILNNNVWKDNKIPNNPKDVSVISSLFSSLCASDKYIYSTFKAFTKNKKKIEICPHYLNKYCFNVDLLCLLFNKLLEVDNLWEVIDFLNNCDSMINLPKKELFEIFSNVEELTIWCIGHPFIIDSLVEVITGTNMKRVYIFGGWLGSVISSNEFIKENWRFKYDEEYHKLIICLI